VAEPQAWLWSDAWVLAAIMMVDDEDGSPLADVVAAADAVNHAILLGSELEPAVRRLLGAGLIGTQQRRFFLTDAGRAMKAAKRGGLLGQVGYLLRALQRLPVSEHEWQLLPGELRQAADSWHKHAQQILAKPHRPRRSSGGTWAPEKSHAHATSRPHPVRAGAAMAAALTAHRGLWGAADLPAGA
jgi:hypothetical protein